MAQHEMVNVTGIISAELAPGDLKNFNTRDVCLILLMGTTGSGKSTFVECMGNNRALGISGDRLEGVTKDITVYRLHNICRIGGDPIYLLDTPGFSDDRITEASILSMVQNLLKENKIAYVDRILYFDRITDIRMTGSKGKSLEIFKAITGPATEQNTTIVTTMWDQLWNERQLTRANERFQSLLDTHFNSLVDEGSIVKFENTHDSSLAILKQCMESFTTLNFTFEHMVRDNIPVSNTKSGRLLYNNLLERILALQQRVQHVEEGTRDVTTQGDKAIMEVLAQERTRHLEDISAIERELEEFGHPPGFYIAQISHLGASNIQAPAGSIPIHPFHPTSNNATPSERPSRLKELMGKKARQIRYLVRQYK